MLFAAIEKSFFAVFPPYGRDTGGGATRSTESAFKENRRGQCYPSSLVPKAASRVFARGTAEFQNLSLGTYRPKVVVSGEGQEVVPEVESYSAPESVQRSLVVNNDSDELDAVIQELLGAVKNISGESKSVPWLD